MRRLLLSTGCLAMLCGASPALAVNFFDDFEGGVSGSVWTAWSGSENLQSDNSHNITGGGTTSARAFAADPAHYVAYADFGATSGFVRAQVFVYEDFSNNGLNGSQPISNMLALVGANGTDTPNFNGDYMQLGVVPYLAGGSTGYSTRTRAGGADVSADTGVDRAAGWTKLAIEADALAAGGQVRYYINDVQVGTSVRSPGVDLRWVRLGLNNKSYENFWYDNVSVVPEPASIVTIGIGTIALAAFRRRRSR